MKKEVKIIRGLVSREPDPFATKVLPDPSALNHTATSKDDSGWSRTIFGRALKRALLAVPLIAMAGVFSGCISVHEHKDVEPSPVIVVPNDHPNP